MTLAKYCKRSLSYPNTYDIVGTWPWCINLKITIQLPIKHRNICKLFLMVFLHIQPMIHKLEVFSRTSAFCKRKLCHIEGDRTMPPQEDRRYAKAAWVFISSYIIYLSLIPHSLGLQAVHINAPISSLTDSLVFMSLVNWSVIILCPR